MQVVASDCADHGLWEQSLRHAGDRKLPTEDDAHLICALDMGHSSSSGEQPSTPSGAGKNVHEPIAICGMGMRLPGNIRNGEQLWQLLVNKRDARGEIPPSRYNAEAFLGKGRNHGYFLGDVELDQLDTSSFKMSRAEIEKLDPQHRVMLEVTRETLENAGETNWRGKNIGCYMGTWGDDWKEMMIRDKLETSAVHSHADFMMANKISFEYDFTGPSVVTKTACSSAMVALHMACSDIQSGIASAAIVGGANILLGPTTTLAMERAGVISPNQSCRTFDAAADGYCRAEAFNMLYIKKLDAAVRDGNPIRAIIRATASNHDGAGNGAAFYPSVVGQEEVIRQCYRNADISDLGRTAHFECHGTGTAVGDPVETTAVANVWEELGGVTIGSAKPNLGHSEGASGLTSVIKSVLALEHKTILPNIKFDKPNPQIPFERGLRVPTEPTAWPTDRAERISITAFGFGGSNAHAILDSAASFGLGPSAMNGAKPPPPKSSCPSLLLLSANRSESAKTGAEKHSQYVASHPDKLHDVAYTLGLHREHLPWRTFAVTDGTAAPEFSAPAKAPSSVPQLNFIFTGQSAQWAGMGARLVQDFPTVADDLDKMDKALSTLDQEIAPKWTLKEELVKSSEESQIHKGEYAQPLSTAIQIALVNLLRSWGVYPAAVVGHSSGEIGAAYASGAITLEHAIICSYLRGYATTHQTRPGGMAAVGLGPDAVRPYLVDGVVVACENSPTTVTLSGDVDKLDEVIQAIKKDSADVMARRLHVNMAYHSHHMRDISHIYAKYLGGYNQSEAPVADYFSTVTGEAIQGPNAFGAEYWKKNLESPVLFNTAIQNLLQSQAKAGTGSMFLEVGPHSALQGPLRQISKSLGKTSIPYSPTLLRNQHDSVSMLSTVGQLHLQGVHVALEAVIHPGKVVTNLPSYSWYHDARFWHEGRLSKEWRLGKWPRHELLGAPIVECSRLQPSWRNMLRVEEVPWLREHMVAKDVILPGAAYIVMACEAMRQVSREIPRDYSLRNVSLTTALTIQESGATEVIFTLRPIQLTKSLDSVWHEFAVSSYNGTTWLQHCTGEVRAGADHTPEPRPIVDLSRKADTRGWYKTAKAMDLHFGPRFRGLDPERTTADPLRNLAVGHLSNHIPDMPQDDESSYPHAIFLDYCFQMYMQAATNGLNRNIQGLALPTFIGNLYVAQPPADGQVAVEVAAAWNYRGGIVGNCFGASNDESPVVKIDNMKFSATADREEKRLRDSVKLQWKPDLAHQPLEDLVSCKRDSLECREGALTLQRLLLLSCVDAQARLDGLATSPVEHVEKFRSWINKQLEIATASGYPLVDDTAQLLALQVSERREMISRLTEELQTTQSAPMATAVKRILDSIEDIYTGDVPGLDVLRQDDLLTQVYNSTTQDWDFSKFLSLLCHRTPNLRVLEIGAGTGATTALIVPHLVSDTGESMFSSYVFTDISAGFFGAAKERFGNVRGMQYKTLDIGVDPEGQGFELGSFDLVVAANVIHATPNLQVTLSNVKKLLRPNGKLVLQELHSTMKSSNFVMGPLVGWWLGEADGRADEPYVSPERWAKELTGSGFDGAEAVILDDEEPYSTNAIIIATPRTNKAPSSKVSILSAKPDGPVAESISGALKSFGLAPEFINLSSKAPEGGIISILDLEGDSIFENISEETYYNLRSFLSTLRSTALWVTRPCQVNSTSPQYAAIIGLTRTLRNETSVSVGTLEVDEFDSAEAKRAIFDVYKRLHDEPDSAEIRPDYEFAWSNGQVLTSRCHWFSLDEEISTKKAQCIKTLEIEKYGSLKTLGWVERPVPQVDAGNVLIDVRAVGMNFKDILVALGVVDGSMGLDCAGVVKAVGTGVTDFKIGDRVTGLPIRGYATEAQAPADHCALIPDDLSFEDASTMPSVYLTVIHSLMNLARLEAGQSVLIHSACGGVGLAAIQIARMIGAEIYTTVGSPDKVQYLMDNYDIPRSRIFHSRDSSFKVDVRRETGGKGVDVVLNSLSGELLHESWECVAEFGTMIELGKRDFIGQGRLAMDAFEDNRAYFGVDMTTFVTRRRSKTRQMMKQMMEFHRQGHIKAISPIVTFDPADIQAAFRLMQQGQHIGKLVVRIPEDPALVEAATTRHQFTFRPDRSYILAGGLGGLGRSISVWMADLGAKNLIYLSRSGGSKPEDVALVKELEAAGCTAQIFSGSVANMADVENAIANARLPIAGVMQFSMVLKDNAFENMPYQDWLDCWDPKVQGTLNLHNALAGHELDFFLMYSSVTGLAGLPGQSNYASANCVLGAFVQARHSQGLPASVIDLGPVDHVGFMVQNPETAAKMAPFAYFLPEQNMLDAVQLAIRNSTPGAGSDDALSRSGFVNTSHFGAGLRTILPLSSPNNRIHWKSDARFAMYRNLEQSGDHGADETSAHGNDGGSFGLFMSAVEANPRLLAEEPRVEEMAQHIGSMLCDLMLKSIDELDVSLGVAALGVDSLVAIELKNWIRRKLGLEVSVIEIMNASSLLDLARLVGQAWMVKMHVGTREGDKFILKT